MMEPLPALVVAVSVDTASVIARMRLSVVVAAMAVVMAKTMVLLSSGGVALWAAGAVVDSGVAQVVALVVTLTLVCLLEDIFAI